MSGVMEELLRDNGKTISFMARGCSLGLTEEFTKDPMSLTPKADLESTNGQTERSSKDNGKMESSMEKESLQILKARLEEETGLMEREPIGLEKS